MTSLLKIADVVEVVVDDDDNNTRDVSLLEENMMLMEEPDDEDEDEDEDDIYSRPIVVGYAFGPKKMSTMGAVMAEASKAKLSTATASVATTTAGASNLFFDTHSAKEADLSSSAHPTASPSPCTLTQARLTKHEGKVEEEEARNKGDASQAAANFVFTIDNGQIQGDLRNIVQHFRSSCSSVGSVSTGVTACSTSVTSAPRTSRASMSCSSVASSFYNRKQQHPHHPQDSKLIPVRVSFVPLDPDIPLEEQHGGKMDVILHKLTEDILCLSQMAMERQKSPLSPPNVTLSPITTSSTIAEATSPRDEQVDASQMAAVKRVRRLIDFQREHPECSLVDSPLAVQTLMSRADIAVTLQACLQTVHTTSGCPVGSPAYAVIGKKPRDATTAAAGVETIEEQVKGLSFPIIVKPLTAAGTKASHAMAVLLDRTALQCVKVPCLCQEYSNHDAVLYKVYVLGDHVSVHKRRSLPNLPQQQQKQQHQTSTLGYIEFDSQRPYPRLSDFGFVDDCSADDAKDGERIIPGALKRPRNDGFAVDYATVTMTPNKPAVVTADEVKPIVDALKEAFGLELFGFDILITSDDDGQRRRMLVVDVNYFPSYKEVPNFPALLAKYLTDLAIASRRKASAARSKTAIAESI